VEDASQSIDATYQNRPLGGLGYFGFFSFQETKSILSGEGSVLIVNEKQFKKRTGIIWGKGTNRAEFFRGEVNKYDWVDTGSSFLPSEIITDFLFAQLEHLNTIQTKRKEPWSV